MAIFQLLFIIRIILFKTITRNYVEAAIIIFSICYPIFLLGLIRYRLWAEKITITRGTIYASLTLFSTGAVLLGLAISVYIFKGLGFSFTFFELFFLIFTGVFFTVLIITSESMRDRITRFFNEHIYTSKYDYHQQFLRLHETYGSENTMQQTINMLIDNLQYTLTISNIYVFMRNKEDGNFYIHQNPESRVDDAIKIQGNSPLVTIFDNDTTPLDFLNSHKQTREKKVLGSEESLIRSLDISALFPIMHMDSLLGLLACKRTRGVTLDREDLQFINVFTESIGDVFFKNQILEERIENKQFESFNHIASFIIHDIKNQVSTLSLTAKNAKSNINNPEFQKSLVRSLESSVSNLQKLVDKFTAPLKRDHLQFSIENINDTIQSVVNDSNIQNLENISLVLELNAQTTLSIDRNSIYYVLMNLVTNAIEAIHNHGTLTITTGEIAAFAGDITAELGISDNFMTGKQVYISVADTGKGMSKEFITTKLFHPFTSTKDKGIGIGLYQCKILIEKMGGKILCASQENHGTRFIIFL